jgi:hypothetical protein
VLQVIFVSLFLNLVREDSELLLDWRVSWRFVCLSGVDGNWRRLQLLYSVLEIIAQMFKLEDPFNMFFGSFAQFPCFARQYRCRVAFKSRVLHLYGYCAHHFNQVIYNIFLCELVFEFFMSKVAASVDLTELRGQDVDWWLVCIKVKHLRSFNAAVQSALLNLMVWELLPTCVWSSLIIEACSWSRYWSAWYISCIFLRALIAAVSSWNPLSASY